MITSNWFMVRFFIKTAFHRKDAKDAKKTPYSPHDSRDGGGRAMQGAIAERRRGRRVRIQLRKPEQLITAHKI
jgi:hypothetical protein